MEEELGRLPQDETTAELRAGLEARRDQLRDLAARARQEAGLPQGDGARADDDDDGLPNDFGMVAEAAAQAAEYEAQFNEDGFDEDGYDREGYNNLGEDREGYNRFGLNENMEDREGFNRRGFRYGRDGPIHRDTGTRYDPRGFDMDGIHRRGGRYDGVRVNDGYDRNGFNRNGIHRTTGTVLDPEGFNDRGYDVNGYNRYGFNNRGWNRYGMNWRTRTRYDQRDFDVNNIHRDTGTRFNPEGFDINGYDEQGFNAQGRDILGLDREGFNEEGYDADGFDREGQNRNGYTRRQVARGDDPFEDRDPDYETSDDEDGYEFQDASGSDSG